MAVIRERSTPWAPASPAGIFPRTMGWELGLSNPSSSLKATRVSLLCPPPPPTRFPQSNVTPASSSSKNTSIRVTTTWPRQR